jgi:proteasome activator subunit 4
LIKVKPDQDLVVRLHHGARSKIVLQDEQWEIFVEKVLGIATTPSLNWRYVLAASRFLYQITRRDRPTDTRLAKFFASNVLNPHPRIRDFGTA